MSDFTILDGGSVLILTPVTDEAKTWADDNLPDNALTFGRGIVVEPRYIGDIVAGFEAEGLTFRLIS